MKTITLSQLLLYTDQLRVQSIAIEEHRIGLEVERTVLRASCPESHLEGAQIHSTDQRNPLDLAWADWGVILLIQVKHYLSHHEIAF